MSKTTKTKKKKFNVRLLGVALLCAALLAGVGYCSAWAATGKANPAEWGTVQAEQPATPDGNEDKPDETFGGFGGDEYENEENGTEGDENDIVAVSLAARSISARVIENDDISTYANTGVKPEWWDDADGYIDAQRGHERFTHKFSYSGWDSSAFGTNESGFDLGYYQNYQESYDYKLAVCVYTYTGDFCTVDSMVATLSFISSGRVYATYTLECLPYDTYESGYAIYYSEELKLDMQPFDEFLMLDDCLNLSVAIEYSCISYPLPDAPVKEGYTFAGWYMGNGEDCDGYCDAYTGDVIYGNTELHAHFTINKYTVNFDSAGGTAVKSITTNWNTTITTTTPEKTGYNFLGWYYANGEKFEDSDEIKSNLSLTARWQIKTFTVTFYVDGTVYTSVTVEYGSVLSDIADNAGVFASNIISFLNVNSETPTVNASELLISDDVTVIANEPTLTQKLSKYLPYIIGVSCAVFLISVIVGAVASKKKKKQG